MTGRRREDWVEPHELEPGDYVKRGSVWWCVPPGHPFLLGNLSKHTVVEHEDGTITVSPSIRVTGHEGDSWHGFLERGVWRAC